MQLAGLALKCNVIRAAIATTAGRHMATITNRRNKQECICYSLCLFNAINKTKLDSTLQANDIITITLSYPGAI